MCARPGQTQEKLMKILHSKGDGDGRGLRGVSLLMLSSCSSKQLAQARCGRQYGAILTVNDGQWLKVGEGNAHQSPNRSKQTHMITCCICIPKLLPHI
jgi:hypothetical protein